MSLTWEKTKDSLIIGLGTLFVLFLGHIGKIMGDMQKAMASVQKDIAILALQTKYDYEERQEMKMRIAALETRRN